MKNYLLIGAFLACTLLSAQVGIKTTTPQKDLHVNGSLQVVNELNVGGDAATAGSAGVTGQILTSAGPGNPPVWSNGNNGSTIVGYSALLSGAEVSVPANNVLKDLDMSLGTGSLTAWRSSATTLTVPAGMDGNYLLTFTSALKVDGAIPSSYFFGTYIYVGTTLQAPASFTSIGAVASGNLNNNEFTLTSSKILTLAAGDVIKLRGLLYNYSGSSAQSFRLARLSLEKIN
ncbi:hypothetical protein [Chryseobacterium sp. AG844]|uniref:hypothetical protein n=1 Tax=Chryseobacterium sp. AG844 TaxID=2183998 RepID=UPI000D71262D|nr:hypothetical protein [Chryseobacterium sp. AG844]PWW25614.1 hypothetical protein DEU40_11125 [Chryseobacterium sp. AG844]